MQKLLLAAEIAVLKEGEAFLRWMLGGHGKKLKYKSE